MLISAKIHISDLHQWKLTDDHYLENKALGRNWKYGNKKWKTHKIGNTASNLFIDKDSGDALGLIEDKLEIGVEVNLTLAHENDPTQKWELIKDKKTGWLKLKKPNGFFLESSENGNDLFIQGKCLLKVICVICKRQSISKVRIICFAFVCFLISTLLKFEISTLLKNVNKES